MTGVLRFVLEQERIVAVVDCEFLVGDVPARLARASSASLCELVRRVQPVGRKREEQERGLGPAEGVGQRRRPAVEVEGSMRWVR